MGSAWVGVALAIGSGLFVLGVALAVPEVWTRWSEALGRCAIFTARRCDETPGAVCDVCPARRRSP